MVSIDIKKRQIIEGFTITAYKNIETLCVCKVLSEKTLLSVGGESPSFSGSETDIFEILNPDKFNMPKIQNIFLAPNYKRTSLFPDLSNTAPQIPFSSLFSENPETKLNLPKPMKKYPLMTEKMMNIIIKALVLCCQKLFPDLSQKNQSISNPKRSKAY